MFALLLTVTPMQSLAKENKEADKIVIFEQKEITDLATLFERAKKGINEHKHEEDSLGTVESEIVNDKTGKKEKVKVFKTTQKLREVKGSNGEVTESYAATVIVTPEAIEYRGEKDSGMDSSYSIKAVSTYHYDYKPAAPFSAATVRTTDANGTWTNTASDVSFYNKKYELWNSSIAKPSQTVAYSTTSNSFSRTAPSSWVPVLEKEKINVGVKMSCTVQDAASGDTWTFTFWNKL
jgi:hypothetical protein